MAATLTVDLNARIAQFETEMKRATSSLDKFGQRGDSIAAGFKSSFAGLAAALSVGALVAFAKSGIDAADALKDMSDRTGVTVKDLASIKLAAEQSGTSLDDTAKAISKLSLSVGQAQGGNAEMAQSLKNLGITAGEPIERLAQLADAVQKNGTSTQTLADLQKVLGKSYADQIPLLLGGGKALRDSAKASESFAESMSRLAPDADKFNDNLALLKTNSAGAAASLLNELVPSLNRTFERLSLLGNLRASGASLFELVTGKISANVGSGLKKVNADIAEIQNKLANNPKVGKGVFFNVADLNTELDRLKSIKATLRQSSLDSAMAIAEQQYKKSPNKPPIDNAAQLQCVASGGKWDGKKCTPKKGPADDPTKNLLDNQLKNLEGSITLEESLLGDRKKILESYNSANLISLKDYFAGKKSAEDQALKNTLASYDLEISALENFRSKTTDKTDKADATGKINELVDKKNKLQQESALSSVSNSFEENKAYQALADQIGNVNAQVLELTGNLHAAAVIRFDQQNKSLRDSFAANGNQAALDQLDALKKYALAQTDINKLSADSGIINDQLANQETRINIARQSGALGEFGTLQQLSVARAAAVGKLEDVYQAQVKIARESGNPKLIQDVENFRVSIESLATTSDLVSQKITSLFQDSAANAFGDFLSGAKTAKEAFAEFGTSIAAEISKLAAQDLTAAIFGSLKGGSGGSSGASDFLGTIGAYAASLFSFDGGGFTGSGSRSGGVDGKGGFPAILHPNETVYDHTKGQSAGAMTMNVYVSGSNSAPDVRRAAGQGAREALSALAGARRYG